MRDACLDIQQFIDGFTWESFSTDKKTQSAVIYKLAIIGEASGKLSKNFTDLHNEFAWRDIKGFRNIVVHNYDRVMQDTVWEITQKEIPEMKNQLEIMIRQQEQERASEQEKEKAPSIEDILAKEKELFNDKEFDR
jgi:uncharacterized protein with HEPN domain